MQSMRKEMPRLPMALLEGPATELAVLTPQLHMAIGRTPAPEEVRGLIWKASGMQSMRKEMPRRPISIRRRG